MRFSHRAGPDLDCSISVGSPFQSMDRRKGWGSRRGEGLIKMSVTSPLPGVSEGLAPFDIQSTSIGTKRHFLLRTRGRGPHRHHRYLRPRLRWHRRGAGSSTSISAIFPFLLVLTVMTAAPRGSLGQDTCPEPLPDGDRYNVSDTAGAADLATKLARCIGGTYNVTWSGAVTLSAPLMVPDQSSLTITRAQWASTAVLDGTDAAGEGLIELGEGSSLRLEGVSLRNGSRGSGNGGAVWAEAEGCSVSAFNVTFESNSATREGSDQKGGAVALGSGSDAVLENCTIAGNKAQAYGGGVSIVGNNASVLFTGCVLEENHSDDVGGAVYVEGGSSVTFSDSVFSGNIADEGGAVYVEGGSSVTFSGSVFSGNVADEGGAVYGTNATVTVEAGSRFVNNTVYRSGAGISLTEGSSLRVKDSTFYGNILYLNGTSMNGTGGAVRVQGDYPYSMATVNISNCTFEGNYAANGSGIYVTGVYELLVERSLFIDNWALDAGGVAFGGGANISSLVTAVLRECNFTGGWSCSGGGALNVAGSNVTISDCNFENNTGFQAGALLVEDNAHVVLERSIFLNNTLEPVGSAGGTGAAISASGARVIATNCTFDNNYSGYEGSSYDSLMGGGAVFLGTRSNASFAECNFTNNEGMNGGAFLVAESSSADLTGGFLISNKAGLHGGAVACTGGSALRVIDSHAVGNSAVSQGGAFYMNAATCELNDVVLERNMQEAESGGGGAVSLWAGSNATINACRFGSNQASGKGGHILANGGGTHLTLIQPVMADGIAGLHGGALHVSSSASVTASHAIMYRNRAEGDGGAVNAMSAEEVCLEHCNMTENSCGGNGGGANAVGTNFHAVSSHFACNEADFDGGGLRGYVEANLTLEWCRFEDNKARMGGGVSTVNATLAAKSCIVTGNSAYVDGGGLRVSYLSNAVLDACEVSSNHATGDGGGIAVDASSDTMDGTLTSIKGTSSTFQCKGGGVIVGNTANERGGALYVTRGSEAILDGCFSTTNAASLGAAVFSSHSSVKLLGGSELALDEAPTGAALYASGGDVVAHNASLVSKGIPSMLAVQITSGTSMKALACSFRGWTGDYVVLTAGELEMDMCDFRGSQAEILVAATNASLPARIRNTGVGLESYKTMAFGQDTIVSENVQTCASDPCGAASESASGSASGKEEGEEEAFAEKSCVDGNLGVYCPCLEATVTGRQECLGEDTALELRSSMEELIAVGVEGEIETSLNITAVDEGGVSTVVWYVKEVQKPYTEEGLTWSIVPDVGILQEGEAATIAIKGVLTSNLNGPTRALFEAVSLKSGKSEVAAVNTTFYFCEEDYFFNEFNESEDSCESCNELMPFSEALECHEPGIMLANLPLAKGYWRSSNESTIIRQCLFEDACKGGSEIGGSNDYCADGYQGPYCAVCSAGYAGSISNVCHRCSASLRVGIYCVVATGALVALILIGVLLRYLVHSPSSFAGSLSSSNRLSLRDNSLISRVSHLPWYKLKIPIVVYQIVTQYADIATVELPAAFTKFLSYVDVVNLDLGWFLSASCLVKLGFFDRLLLVTLSPLAVICALACTFVYARNSVTTAGLPKLKENTITARENVTVSESRQLSVVKQRHMAVVVTLTFLIYSTVSTTVFQTFACDHLEEMDKTYLRADYSLECDTHKHNWFKFYSAVMILVYPVGIPALYAWLLFRHRHRIYPKQALRDGVSPERRLVDKKIAHTILLWKAYRPSRYYYEVIECARRLLLTGCLVFILPNSAGQAAVACVLSVVSVSVFITLRPFTDFDDDRLYVLGCTVIFLSMFASLIPKVSIADVDDQSQTVLSWVLIVLSVILGVMALSQCVLKARGIVRENGSHSHSQALESSSSAVNLIHGRRGSSGGEDSTEPSSGCKGSSPEDPTTGPGNPSSAVTFELELEEGGGRDRSLVYSSSAVPGGGDFDPSGSSLASRTATGYADPVPEMGNGVNGVNSSTSRKWGEAGEGPVAQSAQSSANVSCHGSGNTYGPLAHGGARERFPPIHPYYSYDDFEPQDLQHLHGLRGTGGTRRRNDWGADFRQEERSMSSDAEAAAGCTADVAVFDDGAVNRDVYPAYGGHHEYESKGEVETKGEGRGRLRLSPAGPTGIGFPARTDTRESQQPGITIEQPHEHREGIMSPSSAGSAALTFGSCSSRRQLLGPYPCTQLMGASPATQMMGDSPATTLASGASPATQLSTASPSTQLLGPSPPTSDFTPTIPPAVLKDEGIPIGSRSGKIDGRISGLAAKLRLSRTETTR